MKVELDDSAEKATMSYEFAFSKNFDWTLGGKLPGLCSDGAQIQVHSYCRCIRFHNHLSC